MIIVVSVIGMIVIDVYHKGKQRSFENIYNTTSLSGIANSSQTDQHDNKEQKKQILLKDKPIILNETTDSFLAYGGFINRSRQYDKVCIVLAGYRQFLYNLTFGRLAKYLDPEIDVCILSSGRYDEELVRIAQTNRWSYLYTTKNNICLILNVAIRLHNKAKLIFKLDEDIFITQDYFSKMLAAYHHAQMSEWNPGIIGPLITVNRYSSLRILKRFGCVKEYNQRFHNYKYPLNTVWSNVSAAQFFWGDNGGCLPSLDIMNANVTRLPLEERICPIRYSIGAILYERRIWEAMHYYDISKSNAAPDENQLLTWCCLNNRPVMVSENIIVGHFCAQKQIGEMKQYLLEHPHHFQLPE